jgi:glycosyltransferase involved in cell wall biosynthesis
VFVFPSVAESFGLAVAEAAIVGVPVVSNDLPVLREVLSVDGRSSADFVDANDAGALYAAVTALLDDPARAQALTSNARRLEEHHSLERMVGGYQRILTNAGVGSGKDPASDLGTVDFRSHAS